MRFLPASPVVYKRSLLRRLAIIVLWVSGVDAAAAAESTILCSKTTNSVRWPVSISEMAASKPAIIPALLSTAISLVFLATFPSRTVSTLR